MKPLRQVPGGAPRQLSMALESRNLRGLTLAERRMAVARLARLLMEAAGVAEGQDDEQC